MRPLTCDVSKQTRDTQKRTAALTAQPLFLSVANGATLVIFRFFYSDYFSRHSH